MPDRITEELRLMLVNRNIAEAEMRLTDMQASIQKMRELGADTDNAESLLATIQETLALMKNERQLILNRIAMGE